MDNFERRLTADPGQPEQYERYFKAFGIQKDIGAGYSTVDYGNINVNQALENLRESVPVGQEEQALRNAANFSLNIRFSDDPEGRERVQKNFEEQMAREFSE